MTSEHPPLRPEVASLPAYVPGARAPSAVSPGTTTPGSPGLREAKTWGGATPPVGSEPVKLSSNENPYQPLPAVVAAIADAARAVNRYPDMANAELTAALAELTGVPEANIVVGNGSVAVLGHILDAVLEPGDEVVYAWRSFEAYPICVAIAGGVSVQVPNTADGRHDVPAMAAAITPKTKVVIVCSPNNPTGPAVSADEMDELLAAVPPDVLVILDEAYVEFVRDPLAANGLTFINDHPNLLTLRTLSKAYGLAGLRVGYAIGAEPLIAGVRATATPFGVNSVAQAAAVASLAPTSQRVLGARVAAIVAERTRVEGALAKQGYEVPDAQGNFVWLPLGDQAAEFAEAAAADGVLVRPFAGDGVRVTIADGEANNRFLHAAQNFRSPTPP